MGLLAKLAALLGVSNAAAQTPLVTGPEGEMMERLRAAFPYPIVSVPGRNALPEWERLKAKGEGCPVIVGDDEALRRIFEQYSIDNPEVFPPPPNANWTPVPIRPVEEVLAFADAIDVPEKLQQLFDYEYGEDPIELEKGDWPEPGEMAPMSLTVASDIMTGRPYPTVHIVILPTNDSAEIPAYLRWGNWNACPAPEVHVAVLRKWAKAYGTEVIGISGDVINLRSSRRPSTREEAMALAQEQFLYCSDIVLQGTDTLEPLAMSLMESDWWYFWWD